MTTALSAQRALQAVDAAMKRNSFPALITVGVDGSPRARTVNVPGGSSAGTVSSAEANDARIWIGTARGTRKLDELAREPKAALMYNSPPDKGFACIMGRIHVHDGKDGIAAVARERAWRPDFMPFYQGGPHGGQFVALEFVPDRLEVIDYKHKVADDPDGWAPFVLTRIPGSGKPWKAELA